jgi:hypothetical protein
VGAGLVLFSVLAFMSVLAQSPIVDVECLSCLGRTGAAGYARLYLTGKIE